MATRLYNKVKGLLPIDRPFRVSVRVQKGKRAAYSYVNCSSPSQFKAWLTNNEHKLISIVKID